MLTEAEIQAIIAEIKAAKKYREMDMLEATVRDIILRELPHYKKPKEAIKAARKKLHKVMAPYLGDPDYEEATQALKNAWADPAQLKHVCQQILAIHDSTRERLDLIETFYTDIFAITGKPQTILDIACGLNPLFFPWMGLESLTLYAYDIHQQRVDFLNTYIQGQAGLDGSAIMQDILIHHPQESGDVALVLKELRRLEERQRGCGLPLLQSLKAEWVVVSLPATNLTGRHDLRGIHRKLFYDMIGNQPWAVTELEFSNELVFCINKKG